MSDSHPSYSPKHFTLALLNFHLCQTSGELLDMMAAYSWETANCSEKIHFEIANKRHEVAQSEGIYTVRAVCFKTSWTVKHQWLVRELCCKCQLPGCHGDDNGRHANRLLSTCNIVGDFLINTMRPLHKIERFLIRGIRIGPCERRRRTQNGEKLK